MTPVFDTLFEDLKSRYDFSNDLTDVRGLRGSLDGSQSTKYGQQQYRKNLNKNLTKPLLNKSAKDQKRRSIFNKNQTIMKKGVDGKRTTDKLGGLVNSKTDMEVVGKLANGDNIVRKRVDLMKNLRLDNK